jgi:hypothetical protein
VYSVPGAEEDGRKAAPEEADSAASTGLRRPANDVGCRVHRCGQFASVVVCAASGEYIYIYILDDELKVSLPAKT